MKIVTEKIDLQSKGLNPTFHDVTEQVKEIVKNTGVQHGNIVVYSHHTTCSVMSQECSHDKTYFGLEFLQQYLCNVMEKLIPTCRHEGRYMHPGKEHIDFAMSLGTEEERINYQRKLFVRPSSVVRKRFYWWMASFN